MVVLLLGRCCFRNRKITPDLLGRESIFGLDSRIRQSRDEFPGTAAVLCGVSWANTADRHGFVTGSPDTRTAARRSLLCEKKTTTGGRCPDDRRPTSPG